MSHIFQRLAPTFALLAFSSTGLLAQSDSDAVARIKAEGMERSQVMATLSYLTDVIGPRLTGSPNMKRANMWTQDRLNNWGLYNAHLEPWGPFGRGWSLERFSAQVVSPQNIPLIAFPKAWSPGLRGPYTGEVVYIDAKTDEDLAKYHGKLKGAIVLNSALREVKAHFEAPGARYTDAQLEEMANRAAGAPGRRPNAGAPTGGPGTGRPPGAMNAFVSAARRFRFYQDEGVALVVDSSRGDGGTIFVQSATVAPPPGAPLPAFPGSTGAGSPTPASGSPASSTPATGSAAAPTRPRGGRRGQTDAPAGVPRRISAWDKTAKVIPQMVVSVEQYNRLVRMIQLGESVKMSVDMAVKFYDSDPMAYNTIAEIPGTDLKDEIVMLGAHMDSWHSGTGATDNGAGCAVCMEAVRILKALDLKPRRTIRIGLWSGEEEGLLGSRAYVAQHFGARSQNGEIEKKPDYEKFSSYFNLDNGTGKIRGIYLQGNDAARSLFAGWLEPFKEMGASTVTISNTGGTDHQSFDGIGLPGFQFIQDEIEYETRTHHSNQDVFDRIQEADMKQAAVIMATLVYNAAMMDEKLPRKPVQAPRTASAQ